MSIISKIVSRLQPRPAPDPSPVAAPFEPRPPETCKAVFATGTGRSGTHFFADLAQRDPSILGLHLDDSQSSIGDSFLCYATWNKLPIDKGNFFANRQDLIEKARSAGQHYFESNPYLAFNALDLYQRFDAHILYIHRQPEDVVNSHYIKGWYAQSNTFEDTHLALGYRYSAERPNHFFGRIVPRGDEFRRWEQLTQIGKISWMWNTINLSIIEQLKKIPETHQIIIRLNDFDYNQYLQFQKWVDGQTTMTAEEFSSIRSARPGKGRKKRTTDDWTDQEWSEFLSETQTVRKILDYTDD